MSAVMTTVVCFGLMLVGLAIMAGVILQRAAGVARETRVLRAPPAAPQAEQNAP